MVEMSVAMTHLPFLALGHEKMVYAVCLSIFWWEGYHSSQSNRATVMRQKHTKHASEWNAGKII